MGAFIFNIISMVCMYPVVLLIYFFIKKSVDDTGRYYFGVTKGEHWANYDKEELSGIKATFEKRFLLWLIIFLLIPLTTFFIPYFSIVFSVWMLWLLLCIVTCALPFAMANISVSDWKKRQDKLLQREEQKENTPPSDDSYLVELSSAGTIRCVKPFSLLLPCIVSLAALPIAYRFLHTQSLTELFSCILVISLCTPLFSLCAWLFDKQKTYVISDQATLNINYTRARKNIWKKLWLAFCWANTLFTWLFAAVMISHVIRNSSFAPLLWSSILFCLFSVVTMLWAFRGFAHLEATYRDRRSINEDSDRYWKWGLLYSNPHDHRVLVDKRVGIGTTSNLATPIGKYGFIFTILIFLALPFVCVWLILEEFTPIHLYVKDDTIIAMHLDIDYEIPLAEIQTVSVISEVPDWNKINGSAMDRLEKGTFEIWHEGKCEVFLNPENHYFLKLETTDMTYYLGGYDDSETQIVYELLE